LCTVSAHSLWIALFCTVVTLWVLLLWTASAFTMDCTVWFHCSADYYALWVLSLWNALFCTVVTMWVLSLWIALFGGGMCEAAASRSQVPGWRCIRWGCRHLTLGCHAWALARPRPRLQPPSARFAWPWAATCVLGIPQSTWRLHPSLGHLALGSWH